MSLVCGQAGDNSPCVPKLGSGLKLAPDDEDVCPTCLDPYSEGKSSFHPGHCISRHLAELTTRHHCLLLLLLNTCHGDACQYTAG